MEDRFGVKLGCACLDRLPASAIIYDNPDLGKTTTMSTFDPKEPASTPDRPADEEPVTQISENLEEEDEDDDDTITSKFSIAVSRTDFDVEGIVRRLRDEEIYIPDFQRSYVWKIKQASRFIESLLLGLPVPSIFLAKEPDNRLIVIDGQQRLRSIQYFYDGKFSGRRTAFSLQGVHAEFERETYKSLKDEYRRKLNNSVLSATVVDPLQDSNKSSIYYIFERLNTGGTLLKPQEIRACIYHGEFNKLLHELNENENWRDIYGKMDNNKKDQEMILRFLAFYFQGNDYKRNMKDFINQYMSSNRNLQKQSEGEIRKAFIPTISIIHKSLGNKAFRLENRFFPTIFESVSIAIARRLAQSEIKNLEELKSWYESLVADPEFRSVSMKIRNLTSKENFQKRIEIAASLLAEVE
ncbi:MAG: DUF262 domain-containing protein [Hormoscilla sp. GM7CHS1pb]|nr:DUF262 domain-containing protein [Hormoscilla sp. GM7CHS1pb]